MLPPTTLSSMSWMLLSCLMLLSQVQGENSQEDMSFPRVSCPRGTESFGSHCYTFIHILQSWTDADLVCQKRFSGHLVSVLSGGESSFVANLVSKMDGHPYIWMGLHDPTMGEEPNAGGWEWSNNDLPNFFNWERNPATALDRGYCGTLTKTSGFLRWRDYDCDAKLPYVCKFKR